MGLRRLFLSLIAIVPFALLAQPCTPKPLPYFEDFESGFTFANGWGIQSLDTTFTHTDNCWTQCWLHTNQWCSLISINYRGAYPNLVRNYSLAVTEMYPYTTAGHVIPSRILTLFVAMPELASTPTTISFNASYWAAGYGGTSDTMLDREAKLAIGYIADVSDLTGSYVPIDTVVITSNDRSNPTIIRLDLRASGIPIPPPYRLAFRPATDMTIVRNISFYIDSVTVTDDTVLYDYALTYSDTICQGMAYAAHGFQLSRQDSAGTFAHVRYEWIGDTVVKHSLSLTVLPTHHTTLHDTIAIGDTLFWGDTILTTRGIYTSVLPSSGGCDSVVTLCLEYAEVQLAASATAICPGEEVTLTAAGLTFFRWESQPADSSLTPQQGLSTITVHPHQTTTYYLLDPQGCRIDSLTIIVTPPPRPCVEVSPHYITLNSPQLTFTDCTPGAAYSRWQFPDGTELEGTPVDFRFEETNLDTIPVTLLTCQRPGCCADTTLLIPRRSCEVWFPNVFTPNIAPNNRFGCHTRCQPQAFELTVYSRWSNPIFHTTDPAARWDGTFCGQLVAQGAYAYRWVLTDPDGNTLSGAGTVTVLY